MNLITNLLSTSTLVLSFALTGICSADEPAVTVRYHDLAISTPDGAKKLYERIRRAAADACAYLDHGDLPSKAHKNACADKAIADAVLHVGEPQLFAVYNSLHSVPLPAAKAAEVASR